MTETKIYCDHCGKVLDRMIDFCDITIEANHKYQDVDLCVDCFENLWEQISEYCKITKSKQQGETK